MNLTIEFENKLGPVLRRVAGALEGAGRTEAADIMALEVQALIVRHLQGLAQSRHTTAQRLGAAPTGFLAQAAEAAGDTSAVAPDSDGASIRIRHPAVARAFRDISIAPKQAKWLAIPLHAIAYARRPAQLWDSHQLFIRGSTIFMPQPERQQPLALYALVRSVTQPRDPSLMPSDEEMAQAAATGLEDYIRAVVLRS